MKIKTNITEEREVDIEIPFFRKDDSICLKMLAVINENTVISIFDGGDRTVLVADTVGSNKREILEAYTTWKEIPEDEFLQKHAATLKSLSLFPIQWECR